MFNEKPSKLLRFSTVQFFVPLVCCLASPALSAPLQNWRFDPNTNQLEVTVKPGVKPRYSFMAQPARIVLDLPDTEIGNAVPQEFYNGAVRAVRVSQFQPDVTRIVLELAPNATLSSEQVQLQRLAQSATPKEPQNGGEAAGVRWVLRPLFAGVSNAPATSGNSRPVFSSVRPAQGGTAPTVNSSLLPPAPPSELPPLPSSQIEPNNSGAAIVPDITSLPTPAQTSTRSASADISSRSTGQSLLLSEVNPNLSIPNSLPPATSSPQTPAQPTVTVPPIEPLEPGSSTRSTPQSPESPIPVTAPAPVRQPARSSVQTIEFGEPLPTVAPLERSSRESQEISLASSDPRVVLPTGTRLTLVYPGNQPLKLQANQARQEVLVLQNEIRDRAGRLIVPQGSSVFGKFETTREGSRFVTQAVTVRGQNYSLVGRSEAVGGTRQVNDRRLIQNSGLGALAGAILGGLTGGNVIGGAALGAGVTYVTAPKPATIQPRQVIEVQLTEDFR